MSINKVISNKIFNFYKPSGISSTEFLNFLKQKFAYKKAGFAGTLDPLASGVLVVGIDESTKLLSKLTNVNKQYYVEILFGLKTDTDDITGKITHESLNVPKTIEQINKGVNYFLTNKYFQTPPKYSAVKVNGQRAYKLARKNINFNLSPRLVSLFKVKIISFNLPVLSLLIDVSKGFYVRQFSTDLAKFFNTYATVQKIIRTRCGEYKLKDSIVSIF